MYSKYKDKFIIAFFVVILGALAYLRFAHLGYSDYIPDETTVMSHFKQNGPVLDLDYLAKQRKGPMQWLAVLTVNYFYKDLFNELVFRIPFALVNILSIIFFYKFLETHFEDKWTAGLGAFLFGVNGFMVAFGRVIQYQNFNLLFSSISLYFFARFLREETEKFALFGTMFFTLSLLSHWDAVFILPYLIWVFINRGSFKLVLYSVLITLVMFAPFFVPFAIFNFLTGEEHVGYFATRVGLRNNFNLYEVKFKNTLYNPFLFTFFVSVFTLVSLAWVRKYFVFWFWFMGALAVFAFFVRAPGTHTYNLVIPVIILASAGYVSLVKLMPENYWVIGAGLGFMACAFLFYQSYLIFADLKDEYPWEQEKIFRYETKKYDHSTLTNNIIGFPHGRNWRDVRDYFNSLQKEEILGYTFITNDNSATAGFYMDMKQTRSSKMYLIGVKNPYSFVEDYHFSQEGGKHSINSIQGLSGETVVKIYKTD